MTDGNQAEILYQTALAIAAVRINARLQIAGTMYHLAKSVYPTISKDLKRYKTSLLAYLKAGGCEARITLGQNTFHAQEERLLDLDRVRATIVAIGRRMLHAVWAANGRVRLREL